MAFQAATASTKSLIKKLLFHSPSLRPPTTFPVRFSAFASTKPSHSTLRNKSKSKENQKQKQKAELLVKRRTRSDRELDVESFSEQYGSDGSAAHVPVLLGEVLDVFSSAPLSSFVDCTVGAGGHSAAIIQAHSEMQLYVGLDVDPIAHDMAQARIKGILSKGDSAFNSDLQVYNFVKNFRDIKSVLRDVDGKFLTCGVDGILMDLGMSSMQVNNAERGFSVLNDGPLDMRMNPQASLRAEDILNLWPEEELGRILRDYGEESNWYQLQNKIVKARLAGGLHSTRDLVNLIQRSTSWTRGGRQGWIKTATRVFQALRIAVNDELGTLKDSIHACFDSLASGGRLAIISFHSLEDRIVKQTFINIMNENLENEDAKERCSNDYEKIETCVIEKEAWIKQIVRGKKATVLTKRPITPSEAEERLNPRSRSAKLRVIQKV